MEPVAWWNKSIGGFYLSEKSIPVYDRTTHVIEPLVSLSDVAEQQKQLEQYRMAAESEAGFADEYKAQLKKEFANGILTAAAILQSIHDQPNMAASLLRETCLNFYNCSELDDFDKEHLRKINKETDMHLTGLD